MGSDSVASPEGQVWLVELLRGGSSARKGNEEVLSMAMADAKGQPDVAIKLCHVVTQVPFGLGGEMAVSRVSRHTVKAHEVQVFQEVVHPMVALAQAKKVPVKYLPMRRDKREDGLVEAADKTRATRVYLAAKESGKLIDELGLRMPGGCLLVGVQGRRKVQELRVQHVELLFHAPGEDGEFEYSFSAGESSGLEGRGMAGSTASTPSHSSSLPHSSSNPEGFTGGPTASAAALRHSSSSGSFAGVSAPRLGLALSAGDEDSSSMSGSTPGGARRPKHPGSQVSPSSSGSSPGSSSSSISLSQSQSLSQSGGWKAHLGVSFQRFLSSKASGPTRALPAGAASLPSPTRSEAAQGAQLSKGPKVKSKSLCERGSPGAKSSTGSSSSKSLDRRYSAPEAQLPEEEVADFAQAQFSPRELGALSLRQSESELASVPELRSSTGRPTHLGRSGPHSAASSGETPVQSGQVVHPFPHPAGVGAHKQAAPGAAPGWEAQAPADAQGPMAGGQQAKAAGNTGMESEQDMGRAWPKGAAAPGGMLGPAPMLGAGGMASPMLPLPMGAPVLNPLGAISFSAPQILSATNCFSPRTRLSSSHVASLYLGQINGCPVAVARMADSWQWRHSGDLLAAVQRLASVAHPSLAFLMGACLESRSLVYGFLQGDGTLSQRLQPGGVPGRLPLRWQQQLLILAQVCEGLLLMHQQQPPWYASGCLRAEFLLLDSAQNIRMVLCGAAALGQDEAATLLWMGDPGTTPQEAQGLDLSAQALQLQDTYFFGLLALQLIAGLENRKETMELVLQCAAAAEIDEAVDLVARSAAESAAGAGWVWPEEVLQTLAQVALECAEETPEWRPPLKDVHAQLYSLMP